MSVLTVLLKTIKIKVAKFYKNWVAVWRETFMHGFGEEIIFGNKNIDFITEQMVGHKLGEFSPTRTFRGHVKSDKKSKR